MNILEKVKTGAQKASPELVFGHVDSIQYTVENHLEIQMSLGARTSAYLSTLSMSVPARLALWLGLGLMVFGYMKNQAVFTLVGVMLIAVGIGLWLMFRPKGGGVRGLLGMAALKNGDRNKQTRLGALMNRVIPKRSDKKKAIHDAVVRAQQDPHLRAKRKHTGNKLPD